MAEYNYLAKDASGKTYQGTISADNDKEFHSKLKNMGLYAASVHKSTTGIAFGTKKVKQHDLILFSRQFSTMIAAGLPLTKSLKALEKQTESIALRKVINDVRMSIEGGVSLSEGLSEHPKVFSDFFIALIKAGETAGILKKVLERISTHFEKEDDLRRSVKGAFAYPVIVGVLAILVVGFLVVVIVPVFKNVYERMHLSLPLPTLIMIGLSNAIREFWWLIIIGISGVIFAYRLIKQKTFFKIAIDKLAMNMPVFGSLIKRAVVARFVRTFSDMIESGVPILESLSISGKVTNNLSVSKIIEKMKDNIQKGNLISDALEDQNIFSAGVVQMIASGEESGKLGFMLEKSADGLEREVDDIVKRLVIKIEPLMTFFMACLVGFIAVSIYMPIFDVIKTMSG